MAKQGRRLVVLACVAAFLGGCTVSHPSAEQPSAEQPSAGQPTSGTPSPSDKPNIVFVLTDDLSMNLVPYMDEVGRLASEGTTFNDYFVANSLCCPSRATMLTGKYPHNTGVLTNSWPEGGFDQFYLNDLNDAAGSLMQAAGYRTGFMGKFLNQYQPDGVGGSGARRPTYESGFVPPGWNFWDGYGTGGYQEFNYAHAVATDQTAGQVQTTTGDLESDYVTDVLSREAGEFIDQAADGTGTEGTGAPGASSAGTSPFFLIVSTFGTHSSGRDRDAESRPVTFPPAPRDRPSPTTRNDWPTQWQLPQFADGDCGDPTDGGCNDVAFPSTGSVATFEKVPENPPSWIVPSHYSAADLATLREYYLERIQMAQSINDLLANLRIQLEDAGVLDNTYIVFSSDNGFHLGEHDLWFGKRTAYDHDINVPLIIRPPGGSAPATVDAIAQNTDLLPTWLDIAGTPDASAAQDGRSLLPLLGGESKGTAWRTGAFVEQRAENDDDETDPDSEAEQGSTHPPSYRAIRTASYLYVDYAPPGKAADALREAEFYDLANDPNELTNIYDQLSATDKLALARAVLSFASCIGPTCREVDQTMPTITPPGAS